MGTELNKLAAEFNRYFTSSNGVDVSAKVSVSRDEWRALFTAIQQAEAKADEPVLYIHPSTFEMNNAHVGAWKPGHELPGYIPLFTHPAPAVPDDVVRGAISTVREQYRGTDWGKAAECICDTIDAAMLAASSAQKGGE